jgi:hypothetical protein
MSTSWFLNCRMPALSIEIESKPVDQPYLWREATLLDPNGNRIFVYHAGGMRLNPPWRLESQPSP